MAAVAGDVIRTTARYTFLGDTEINNVFHCRVVTEGSGGDAGLGGSLGGLIDTAMFELDGAFQAAFQPVNFKHQNLTQDVLIPDSDFVLFTGGTSAAQAASPQVAVLSIMPTLLPKVQGRKFFGPIAEDVSSGGGIIGATADAFTTSFSFLVGVETLTTGWEIEFGVYRKSDGRFTPFIDIRTIPNTRTQRRRTQGFGS
jgi:hypothetical protein